MKKYTSPSEQVSWLKSALFGLSIAFVACCSILGFLLHEETSETTELKEELRSTESQLQVILADYYELEASAGNIKELEAENRTLSAEVSNLEHQVDAQTVEIASLEAALEAAQSKPSSSGSSGSVSSGTSSGSSGTTSSTIDTQSVTVYITNTGSKYHKNGCQYLRESKNAVTLTQAKSWGYTACSRCY